MTDPTDEPSPFRDEGNASGAAKPVFVSGKKSSYSSDPRHLLPQSPDAEKGALSSMMNDSRCCEICREKQVTKEWFFIPAHGTIFDTVMEQWDRGLPCDFIAVTQILRDRGQLEHCGGAAFITDLFTFLPTAANIGYYLEVLSEKLTLRRIATVCAAGGERAYTEQDNVPGVLEDLEREVMAIRTRRETRQKFTGKDVAREGLAALERKIALHGRISGLSTGFAELDQVTDGLHGAELIVLAALPSLGKTALAMQIAEYLAIDSKIPIVVFSLEMSRSQFSERWIASRARVNTVPWRYGASVSDGQIAKLRCAASEFHVSRIFVEEASDMTIQEVRSSARSLVRAHGIKAIFIDSLSVMRSTSKQARDNRYREVSECINGCKEMAKELNVPVIVIAHLKPQGEINERPNLADLRESGNIAQDADGVWMLWQPAPEEGEDENPETPRVQLWIPKNRNGERFKEVPLIFQKSFTRFAEPTVEETAEQGDLI